MPVERTGHLRGGRRVGVASAPAHHGDQGPRRRRRGRRRGAPQRRADVPREVRVRGGGRAVRGGRPGRVHVVLGARGGCADGVTGWRLRAVGAPERPDEVKRSFEGTPVVVQVTRRVSVGGARCPLGSPARLPRRRRSVSHPPRVTRVLPEGRPRGNEAC